MNNQGQVLISLFAPSTSISEYLQFEIENSNISIELKSLGDNDDIPNECDAVVFLEGRKSAYERSDRLLTRAMEASSAGKQVIWLVVGDDAFQVKVEEQLSGINVTNLNLLENADTENVLDTILSYSEQAIQNRVAPPKVKSPKRRVRGGSEQTVEREAAAAEAEERQEASVRNYSFEPEEESSSEEDETFFYEKEERKSGVFAGLSNLMKAVTPAREDRKENENLPDVLENVIAVSGYSGAGVSYIAWNIAECLENPALLMEGRTTGSLASWFGRINENELVSREAVLAGKMGTPHGANLTLALKAHEPLSLSDLQAISGLRDTVVVDCGSDFHSEVFARAKTKVFVLSPDPTYLKLPRPNQGECLWVLNNWPAGMSFSEETLQQSFNRKFHLVVPAKPRQAILSIWTKRAWIQMEDEELVMHPWRKLFESE